MKNKIKGFTLIELIIVIIILGILAAVAIPMYTNVVEQRKGDVCINNMRTIFAAWRIYNMRGSVWTPNPVFQTVSQINTQLGILVDERNFGQRNTDGEQAGFYMEPDTPNTTLHIRAYRLSGSHNDECLACFYDYSTSTFNWNPNSGDWVSNWPWLPNE